MNLSSEKSNLRLEYFDITFIWECSTCGASQACAVGSTKACGYIGTWFCEGNISIQDIL